MNQSNQRYVKAFNQGFIMAEYMPDLLTQIAHTKDEHPYIKAIEDGKVCYEWERSKKRLRELKQTKSQVKNRDRGRERL